MKRILIAGLVLAVLALTLGMSIAQRGRGGPAMRMGQGMGMGQGLGASCGLGLGLGMGPSVVTDLNLSNSQVVHLQKITDQFVSDTHTLRAQLQSYSLELARLWTADTPNKSAIRQKVAEVDSVRAQIRNVMMERTFAVMSVLTPQQKAELRSNVKNRPGFGMGLGCGLGLGAPMNGAGCYFMGRANGTVTPGMGQGRGFRGGRR